MGRSGRRPALDRASLWQTTTKGPSPLSCRRCRRRPRRRRPRRRRRLPRRRRRPHRPHRPRHHHGTRPARRRRRRRFATTSSFRTRAARAKGPTKRTTWACSRRPVSAQSLPLTPSAPCICSLLPIPPGAAAAAWQKQGTILPGTSTRPCRPHHRRPHHRHRLCLMTGPPIG